MNTFTPFRRFAPCLRRVGFRKKWDSRAGGVRVAEWTREEPDGRTLVCQLWADGQHRISHEWVGCTNTHPTDFEDEDGLAIAIHHEATRTDNHYRDPNNHYVPFAREFLLARRPAPESPADERERSGSPASEPGA